MKRKLGILLVIFLACYLAAHFYIKWKNRSSFVSEKTTKLVDCVPNRVREITVRLSVSGKMEELKFQRVDQAEPGLTDSAQLDRAEWRLEDTNKGAEADSTYLNRVASMVCGIYDPVPLRASEAKAHPPGGLFASEVVFQFQKDDKNETHSIRFNEIGQNKKNVIEHMVGSTSNFYQIAPELLQVL